MRILAIDYGTRRVGLAVSDPSGTLASPLRTLRNEGSDRLLIDVVTAAEEAGAERILVGLPVRTDGTFGPEVRRILKFAHRLAASIDIPVTGLNEAFTTSEALSRLKHRGGKRQSPTNERRFIDQMAAVLLLEEYLADVPAVAPSLPPVSPPQEG